MSVVRGFGINGKSYYTNIAKPSVVHCTFTVAPADSGGLGITSLKSNGYVNNVFMNTSETPGSNNGQTNPNPAAGYAVVQFNSNFNYFVTGFSGFVSPNSGSDVKIDNSAMTEGQVYTITTLGNATAAKWTAVGVPNGVTPAVGVSFVALTDGGSGNTLTSRVQVPSVSGVTHVEMVGNPNTMKANSNIASYGGAYCFLQFMGPTSASVTTMVATAPAVGSTVSLTFYYDASSVTVDGL